jgi:hypothetical protein
MIWGVKQFITHQTLDMELEQVRFPIRVEGESQNEGACLSPSRSVKSTLQQGIHVETPFSFKRARSGPLR